MATRSKIGMLQPDGSILAVYCHWDGYPSHNGKILNAHYTERSKVQELMDLGDLSSLGPEIGEKHDFDAPPKGQCNAYGRDREEGGEADHYLNEAEFLKSVKDSWGQWAYLFTPEGKWLVNDCYGDPQFLPLEEMLQESA
jgi:hypothetical protein